MSNTIHRSSNLARGGAARKATTNTFSHLAALSDSEEDVPVTRVTRTLQAMLEADPVLQAMIRGDTLWGDLMYEEDVAEDLRLGRVHPVYDHAAVAAAELARAQAELEALSAQEATIWDQPFAGNLEMYWGDCYDTRALTDAEYEACMAWLYDQGWEVEGEIRDGMKAWPADLPPRVWVPERAPSRFDALHTDCNHGPSVTHVHQAPQGRRAPAPKKSVTVPRFCRDSCGGVACADAACRYVHADTMPRMDKPCGFGAACGASDPTGVKRSQCLYMHPGETWSADLVIRRPVVAAPVVAAQ